MLDLGVALGIVADLNTAWLRSPPPTILPSYLTVDPWFPDDSHRLMLR